MILLAAMAAALPFQAARKPPAATPFKTTLTVAQMTAKQAVVETSAGTFVVDLRPDLAPNHVGYFMKLAGEGAYANTLVHRVVKGFVLQTGSPAFRGTPLTPKQAALVHTLPPEFTPTPNLPGVVSMARGDDPASATSSFFICTGECRSLDNQYTVFAVVESGMDVVAAIDAVAVTGEAPVDPVTVTKLALLRR